MTLLDRIPLADDHTVLHGESWDDYERVLEEICDGSTRVTYRDGSMEIMSPLPKHELVKKAIARLIELIELTLDIPLATLGNTTFRSGAAMKGLEPDECYYVQNEPAVRGMDRFDPEKDPPPDLAVEVDVFGRSIAREPIYAALGVPEIWRYRDGKLEVLALQSDEPYIQSQSSSAFRFLPMATFEAFVQ